MFVHIKKPWVLLYIRYMLSQYGKFGRYFRTSSSAKWEKRSINSFFHLFIQFQWENLLKQMENLIYWSFFSFGRTWGSEISAKFSIQCRSILCWPRDRQSIVSVSMLRFVSMSAEHSREIRRPVKKDGNVDQQHKKGMTTTRKIHVAIFC